MANQLRSGIVPPRTLHVLAPRLHLSDVRDLRCSEPGRLHLAPSANEHSIAGAGRVERTDVARGGESIRPAHHGGRRNRSFKTDRLRVPHLSVTPSHTSRARSIVEFLQATVAELLPRLAISGRIDCCWIGG